MVSIVPYHMCIRAHAAGYNIGRIRKVAGRLCVEAHILIQVHKYVLQD